MGSFAKIMDPNLRVCFLVALPDLLFHATRAPSTLMRINFANTQEAEFWRAFEKMRDAVRGG